MANASNIENPHYRELLPAARFSAFIPSATGSDQFAGKGYTDLSIELMSEVAVKFTSQAEKLAYQLKKDSLEETCKSIKEFLYHNFQYKADTQKQLLRTLSRAWQDRKDGIDCKSYSLIASQILLQLGIKHYFRKIKQKNNGQKHASFEQEFSHVFVIVPQDQNTGNLGKGYYVIDGVVPYYHEPPFTESKDHFMNPHHILNGVAGSEPITILKVAKTADADGDPTKAVAQITIATEKGPQSFSATGEGVRNFLTKIADTGQTCYANEQARIALGCVLVESYPEEAKKEGMPEMADPEVKHAGGGGLAPTSTGGAATNADADTEVIEDVDAEVITAGTALGKNRLAFAGTLGLLLAAVVIVGSSSSKSKSKKS